MRIGVIGGGISGMVSAYLLNQEHDVELLEARDYIGGHTHTEEVELSGARYRINTGFIVFNEPNYPNFLKLLNRLQVPYQPAPMTFSVHARSPELEYGFATLDALFAQRRNVVSPKVWRMCREIKRFQSTFDSLLSGAPDSHLSLADYLQQQGYSQYFIDYFLMPFGAAIWSASPEQMGSFPLRIFVAFFKHHGFLNTEALLQWHTVKGGSASYVEKLIAPFRDKVATQTPVTRVVRQPDHIAVHTQDEQIRRYDRVILAVHSDQALQMLEEPTAAEREVLGCMQYQPNDVVLHTDTALLPARRKTWSSWNYAVPRDSTERCSVTYDMNILQAIESEHEFLISLNQQAQIDPAKVLGRYLYNHPSFTPRSAEAQARHGDINGVDRIHYAGAYWGFGFHEDGVNSALAACAPLGGTLD